VAPALDLIAVGESLVDFLPEQAGQRVRDVLLWRRQLGGSLANVAVGLSRLGGRAAILGVVGQDEFGHFLREALEAEGVDVSHLRQTAAGKTGLVFISVSATGERAFTYHRASAAEFLFGAEDVDDSFLAQARAVHFGTNSILRQEARAAMAEVVRGAHARGQIVSCDPNVRLHLWQDPAELRASLEALLPRATVVKLAEDELAFVTGQSEPRRALQYLADKGVALPVATLGARGAMFLWKGAFEVVSAPPVKVVDTTGAGDGFDAGLLRCLTGWCRDAAEVRRLSVSAVRDAVHLGCEVGARVVQVFGAVNGLPQRSELADVLPEPRLI
jgi:fructokinase